MHYIFCKNTDWTKALANEITTHHTKDYTQLTGFPLIKVDSSIDFKDKYLAFSTTALLNAKQIPEDSVAKQVHTALEQIHIDDNAKINCHVFALTAKYGIITSGRASIVKEKIINGLKKKNIYCLRKGFDRSIGLLQVLVMPDRSLAFSYINQEEMVPYHSLISPFEGGFNNVDDDKQAPSRAYRKIVEAQIILGKSIAEDELVVDLGACPGGWTYIARKHGARVIALDRSPLDDSLMSDEKVTFLKEDAFKYQATEKVDWVVSDIISTPQRILELIEYWVKGKNCTNFIFTIKFQGDQDYGVLDQFKIEANKCDYQVILKQLNANKNEVTIMGTKS